MCSLTVDSVLKRAGLLACGMHEWCSLLFSLNGNEHTGLSLDCSRSPGPLTAMVAGKNFLHSSQHVGKVKSRKKFVTAADLDEDFVPIVGVTVE